MKAYLYLSLMVLVLIVATSAAVEELIAIAPPKTGLSTHLLHRAPTAAGAERAEDDALTETGIGVAPLKTSVTPALHWPVRDPTFAEIPTGEALTETGRASAPDKASTPTLHPRAPSAAAAAAAAEALAKSDSESGIITPQAEKTDNERFVPVQTATTMTKQKKKCNNAAAGW